MGREIPGRPPADTDTELDRQASAAKEMIENC